MKANTKPAKPIDLSTCQIGQKMRLRDRKIVRFDGSSYNASYPYKYTHPEYGMVTVRRSGRVFISSESEEDIVAILPLPKPKKPRATPAAPKMSKKEILKAITYFRGILQALEDQIKP